MTIDHNVCAAHRLADEPAIGPLEEAVLGAMEEHDDTHRAWSETRKALAPLFERVLSAWLYPFALIHTHDRTKGRPRCLANIRVGSGNARGAEHFRIVGTPSVTVDNEGDPSMSSWSVRAVAISSKTGRDMSGNTPNRRTTTDGTVTLTGFVFFMGLTLDGEGFQKERDDFIRMVAKAEAILAGREQVEDVRTVNGQDV